jgi:hypothetical protein
LREQAFKSNKKEWEAFAARVHEDIVSIEDVAIRIGQYEDIPEGLGETIDHLSKCDITPVVIAPYEFLTLPGSIRVLTDIRDSISKIRGRGKLQRLANVDDDPTRIKTYLDEITHAIDRFMASKFSCSSILLIVPYNRSKPRAHSCRVSMISRST